MDMQKNQISSNAPSMCKKCQLFYASEAYQGLCSTCFKKNHINKKEEPKIKEEAATSETVPFITKEKGKEQQEVPKEPIQKDRKRCFNCNKKVGLLGIQCKCGFVFCNMHRLPEDHKCDIDYKGEGKKKLEQQMVKVYNGKISSI